MQNLQEYIKDQIINEQLILEGGSKGVTYNSDDKSVTIDCKYCSIKILIENVSLLLKDKELLSGKEIFDNIDLDNMENNDAPALIKFLNEKKDEIEKRIKKINPEDTDVTDLVLRIKDAQLWPPGGTKLDEYNIECYLDFSIDLSYTGPMAVLISGDLNKAGGKIDNADPFAPNIEFGDLHVTGLGKVHVKAFLKSYMSLSTSYYKILFYIFKNFVNTDEKSFKSIAKAIEQGVKKGIKDNVNDLKKLPDTIEIDKGLDIKSLTNNASGILNKK